MLQHFPSGVNLISRLLKSPVKTTIAITMVAFAFVVSISVSWEFLHTTILPNTKLGIYTRGFWGNFLVEMHGLLFDLLIFGILIYWLESSRSTKNEIKNQLEDLTDYALLDFPEINTKKVGHLKRLNNVGITEVNVQNLTLTGMFLKNTKVENSKMIGLKVPGGRIQGAIFSNVNMRSSNFEKTVISTTIFVSSDLAKSNFTGATCQGVSFVESILERVDFSGCNLKSANLCGCNLRGAKFKGANLAHCNILNAEHIDVNELAKADCLDYIKTTHDIVMQLARLKDDMKYQKDKRRT